MGAAALDRAAWCAGHMGGLQARTMWQVKLIEENAPDHLDNHSSIRMMICKGWHFH